MDIVMQTVYICKHMNICGMTYGPTVYTVDIKSLHIPVKTPFFFFFLNESCQVISVAL